MEINILQIGVICVLAGVAYWANNQLNDVPVMKTVVSVIIVVVGVLLLLQACGLMSGMSTHVSIR